jgi:hypothetical protein
MCDYSLQNVKSRPAKVGDKLTTHNFYTGTCGFAAPEDANTAVCVLPGTELAFAKPVIRSPRVLFGWKANMIAHTTAIVRQVVEFFGVGLTLWTASNYRSAFPPGMRFPMRE